MRLTSILCAAGLLAAAGCAPDGSGGTTNLFDDIQTMSATPTGQSPEQRALSQQAQDYARVRVQSAAIGAGLAGLACYLGDCTPEQTAAAAVAGAAAAYLAGGYLTNENRAFQATQQTLQRDIQLAQEDNQRLAQSVSAAEQVVAYQRAEIARLNSSYSAGTVSADQYKARLATMQRDVASTNALIATSTERVGTLGNSIDQHRNAGFSTSTLAAERSREIAQIDRLRAAERAMIANIRSAPAAVQS